MISTHDGRKRGGIWLKIKPQIRVLAYTLPISFFSDSRRLRRLNINLFFLEVFKSVERSDPC